MVVTIMKICVSVYRHVYTPTHCSETGKGESKCTHLLKSGRIMDDFFFLQTFLHQFCCIVIIKRKCDLKSCLGIRGTPGESNSVTTYIDWPSTLLPLLLKIYSKVSRGCPWAVSLRYLSSSSFSLFSLSSFSLCSRASRLFSASSLVASSGSVVPAEVFGEALAVRVDDGAGVGAGVEPGAGAGAEAAAGAAVQIGTRRKPIGNKSQRTKQKLASPRPQA